MSDYMTVSDFITAFAKGTLGNRTTHRHWRVEPVDDQMALYFRNEHTGITKLVFTGTKKISGRHESYRSELASETVAYRYPDGRVIYNANVLMIATRKAGGVAIHDHERADCQILLNDLGAKPLPFTLFAESGMRSDVAAINLKVVAQGAPEMVYRKTGRQQYNKKKKLYEDVIDREHFVGASIYKIGDQYFLFDYDRKEQVENKIFNPFIVELPEPSDNFDKAYESLMPEEIKKAKKAGKIVERQGEFFFVKIGGELPVKIKLTKEEEYILKFPPSREGFFLNRTGTYYRAEKDRAPLSDEDTKHKKMTEVQREFQKAALRYKKIRDYVDELIPIQVVIGGMSSHTASKGVRDQKTGKMYVSGTIKHTAREHGDLQLEGWWQVVPNRAVKSVTIQGRID